MEVYPLVLPKKVKISIEGLRVLCIMWWKRKFICGMFRLIKDQYGGFDITQEVSTLGGEWTNGRKRESTRVGNGKVTKLDNDLIALWDTLLMVQADSW